MRKITFENKITSLDINSKYVISSVDVNEIKTVVNSFSNSLTEQVRLDKEKFRYIFINLPKKIDKRHDVEIEVSEDNWLNDIRTIKLSNNSDKFYIFNNGEFKHLANDYISNVESGKILVINIESLINKPTQISCRFRFKNILDNGYTEYFSVDLNTEAKVNNKELSFIGYKFFTVTNLKYKDQIINLLNFNIDLDYILNSINYIFDEKTEISLSSFIYDGKNIFDVTNLTVYSTEDEEIQLSGSIINPFKTQTFKRFIINSSINYNNENLTNKCNISLNPIYLSEIEGSFSSINYVNQSYKLKFFAKYSNQTKIDIADDSNFALIIKNNNFTYDSETHILTPIKENSIDEITILYRDHDFVNEYLEKTYTLKIEGVKLYNIVGKIENEYLTTLNNKTNYSVSAFYSDDTVKDITNDENLEITIFNNKEREYNTLSIDKINSEISVNNIIYDDAKYISFSLFDEKSNKAIHTLNKINLINSSIFSISGIIITSNGNNALFTPFNSDLKSFEIIKMHKVDEDMSDYKKIPNLSYNILLNEDKINCNLSEYTFKNKNCYYKADIYLNSTVNDNLFLTSLTLPNEFNFYKNKNYKLNFSTISKMEGANFSKDVLIEIDKNFDENYIIGFKNIKFPIIDSNNQNYNIIELIGLSGIFKTSTDYEFQKSFIYDEKHDIWLIDSVPLKTNKLKSLNMNFAYLNDKNGYSWINWNLKRMPICGYKGFKSDKLYRYKITTDWDRPLYSNGYYDPIPYSPNYKVDGHYITEIIYDEDRDIFKEIIVESSKSDNPTYSDSLKVGTVINEYQTGVFVHNETYWDSDCYRKVEAHEDIILTNELGPNYGIDNLRDIDIEMAERNY